MILSIIIPVYNVERYIDGTLHSIYSQGIDEQMFEVIVVDDGTPDNSMTIVERYAMDHQNLSIIHQKNQGLSCARNAGLDIAKGDYLWFVDSDDQLAEGAIEQVVGSTKEFPVDIIGFDMVKVSEESGDELIEKIIFSTKLYGMYNKPLTCYDILHKTHAAAVPRFVFKHSFIVDNCLRFYPGIIHEDFEFMAKAYFLAKDIVFVDMAPYRYLLRTSGSIMTTLGMSSVYSLHTITNSLHEFSESHCKNLKQRKYFDVVIFDLSCKILKRKIKSLEYANYIRAKKPYFRSLAWKGTLANIYRCHPRGVVKGLIVCVSPILFMKISK